MNRPMSPYSRHSGFTLLELLIVLALSAFLSAAVVQIVIGNSKNVKLTDSYSKVQDSARYTLDFMSRDIRMAGYMGCINNTPVNTVKVTNLLSTADADYVANKHSFLNPVLAINDYADTGAKKTMFDSVTRVAGVPIAAPYRPVTNTDIFITSAALPTEIIVSVDSTVTATTLLVQGPANQISALSAGSIVTLSDCFRANIFSISGIIFPTTTTATITHGTAVGVAGSVNNTASLFANTYVAGSQLVLMNTTVYFIAKSTSIASTTANPVNSLYRVSSIINGGKAEELVPYVQDMQLTYAVDTAAVATGTPVSYLTADEIQTAGYDMADRVFSVNISILVAGDVDVKAPQVTGYPKDGKIRKRYSRLVNVRNAGLSTYN